MHQLRVESTHHGSGKGRTWRFGRHSHLGCPAARSVSAPAIVAICARSTRYPAQLGSEREASLLRASRSGQTTSTSRGAAQQGRSQGRYQIGGLIFNSKEAVGDRIHTILHTYNLGDQVRREQHPEDFRLLDDLLRHHPAAAEKAGCGVSHFEVRKPPAGGQRYRSDARSPDRCFWLVRTDGTSEDWSYLKCVKLLGHDSGGDAAARARIAKEDALKALRSSVQDQVDAFRRARTLRGGLVVCEATGKEIPSAKAHVDHVSPHTFKALVAGWLVREGLAGVSQVDVADETQVCRWQQYHKENAVLRMVNAQLNLSRK